MKKIILLLTLAFIGLNTANAQVGIGTTNPDASAALDVDVSSLPATGKKGFLPPRMDNAQRGTITSPVPGLTIYNTEANCLQWYDGSFWYDGCSGSEAPDPLPENITLEQVATYYIASADDTDYLDGSGNVPNNTTEAQLPGGTEDEADGATTETAIDIQGTLTTTGVTINIPYEVFNAPTTLPAFEQTITIPAEYTEDGVATDVKFSYPEQTSLGIGTGVVPATLQAVGTDLNVIKFDYNSGLGADYLGFLLGKFVYALDSAGTYADLEVRGTPGHLDKNIGDGVHDFVYLPVTGPSGKTWLNLNLGADYANINDAAFDPTQQATEEDDFRAYGSLFQWGRVADGHEIVDWTGPSSGDETASVSTTSSNPEPNNGGKIISTNNWYVGSSPAPDDLWQEGTKTTYDPCPLGYRVPSEAEIVAEKNQGNWGNQVDAYNSTLRLTTSGWRNNGGNIKDEFVGYLWSSTTSGTTNARRFRFNSAGFNIEGRSDAFPIRCIKH